MGLWFELGLQIIRRIFSMQFIFYFLFAVALVALMYRRMYRAKIEMYGFSREHPHALIWEVLKATGLGLFGGIAGSFLMVVAGVSLNNIGIGFLWILAITLFLINPRYLCFSYAGGLLSLSYLLFGFPMVEVPQLMGLVAILHLVESFLILLSGHLGALPVYAQGKDKVVGGFTLQRFWPIPLVVMFLVPVASVPGLAQDLIAMPNWWSLIRSPLAQEPNVLYTMLPVVAALGYGDLALTDTPGAKSRWSASRLATYSIVLLLLSISASYWAWVAWLAALFGPLGHEYLIIRGQKRELEGEPLFSPPEEGVMILDVHPGSPAARMGLVSGDIIYHVNGYLVRGKEELSHALDWQPSYLTIDYVRKGRMLRTQGRVISAKNMGVIFVPEEGDVPQVQFNVKGALARWWEGFRRKKKN